MKIAVFFPGQGSQKPGMGQEFYNDNADFKAMFDACDANTDIGIKKACFEGEGLDTTAVTQPALYSVNIATYKMLEGMGIAGDVFAGLSLGEYDALSVAGVIDAAQTTALVSERGKLMESAVPEGVASMTAVIGITADEIERAIGDIDDVWVANMNAPGQTIIGGKLAALDIADVKVKEAGASVVKRLNVAGPFHTPLLAGAGEKLKAELQKYEISATDKTVYANVTGAPYAKDDDIRGILSAQVSNKVHWAQIMEDVITTCDVIIECGPGNVLSKMAKRQAKSMDKGSDVQIFKASSAKDIEAIKKAVIG